MSPANSGSLTSLRELNRLRVLETVRSTARERAEISRQTGLARSTVSSLVSDLHRAGLVVESTNGRDTASSRGGRPPVARHAQPGRRGRAGHRLRPPLRARRGRRARPRIIAEAVATSTSTTTPGRASTSAAALADELVERSGVDRDRVLGVGVAVVGPIDQETGTLGSTTILPGWAASTSAAELEERLGLPVHIDNDANLGALAEVTARGRPRRPRRRST